MINLKLLHVQIISTWELIFICELFFFTHIIMLYIVKVCLMIFCAGQRKTNGWSEACINNARRTENITPVPKELLWIVYLYLDLSGISLNYYMYWTTKVSLDNFLKFLYFAILIHATWFTETILISFKKEQDMSRFSLLTREDDLNLWIDCIKTCFHFGIFIHAVSFTLGMETMISHFVQLVLLCTLCALAFFNSDKIWLFLMNWDIWNCTSVMNFKKEEKLLTFMNLYSMQET